MNLLLVNIVLALVWGAVTASFAPGNLVFGFVLGFLCLWLVRDRFNPRNFHRPGRALGLAGLFLLELCLSAGRVARDTLRPNMTFRPAIIAFPLEVQKEGQIMRAPPTISVLPTKTGDRKSVV